MLEHSSKFDSSVLIISHRQAHVGVALLSGFGDSNVDKGGAAAIVKIEKEKGAPLVFSPISSLPKADEDRLQKMNVSVVSCNNSTR